MKTKFKHELVRKIFKYRNDIDLNPAFQREKVWSQKKQQYFIDTILRGWGIPKLYLAVENQSEDYICIDGKQRLIALFSFLSNKLKLNGKFSSPYANKVYKDLPRVEQDKIDDYKLPVEIARDYTDQEIAELFKRLQGGSLLNSGERLMAVPGDLKIKINNLSRSIFFKKKVILTNKRYAHFTVCVQLVFLEVNGISNLSLNKLEDMLKLYEKLNSAGLMIKSKLDKIGKVLNLMGEMFPDQCSFLKNRATIVSFYLLIAELMDKTELKKAMVATIYKFMKHFSFELDAEIAKGVNAKDAQLINYQSAITQGADKQKTIKLRREILLNRLIKFDPNFYKIFFPMSEPTIEFNELYGKFEEKFNNSVSVDTWIFSKKPKLKKYTCRKNKPAESLPTHIRHCIHHKSHGKFSLKELKRGMVILNGLKNQLA